MLEKLLQDTLVATNLCWKGPVVWKPIIDTKFDNLGFLRYMKINLNYNKAQIISYVEIKTLWKSSLNWSSLECKVKTI